MRKGGEGGWWAAGAGLPAKSRTDDLRHANASWMLANGVDLVPVKERLGHSNISITSRYLRAARRAGRALAALDTALGR
jgi:site-specific recombinase XerD